MGQGLVPGAKLKVIREIDCFDYVLKLFKTIIKLVNFLLLFNPEIKSSLRHMLFFH